MADLNSYEKFKQVTLHKVIHAVDRMIPNSEAYGFKASCYVDLPTDNLILSLQRNVLTERKESKSFQFPETWWDGFKIEYFPAWLRRRYPAKVRRVECSLDILYPNLKASIPGEHSVIHFAVKDRKEESV